VVEKLGKSVIWGPKQEVLLYGLKKWKGEWRGLTRQMS
jgi:hypothetical protein